MERTNRASIGLLGRRRECARLDDLLDGLAGGHSASLLLHGEAGIGKTSLLDYAEERASACRIARVTGAEAEIELAFGGLHQLCAPFGDKFATLPDPQRIALETAFGLSAGPPPDRFLVGLAVLTLLSVVAEERPLVCLVDDAHWLDQISAQTLAFVARRVMAERILLVFAMRDPIPGHPLQDLPQMQVEGLDDHDARTLLALTAPGRTDERVRERILAEAHGNPLALLELPRETTSRDLTVDTAATDVPVASALEKEFQRRLENLTPSARLLILLAAAEPVGDIALLRRAAHTLGIDVDAVSPEAQESDLITARTMVRFRHPLVRSAALRSASLEERQRVHSALAEVTDPELDPDRRIWHLSSATLEPDEEVAAALEQASVRARSRGGIAAAAAFLDRAAQLTADPQHRGARTLAAAQAKSQAGEYADATDLLDEIRLEPLGERDRAHAELVRGRVLFASQSAATGLPVMLSAAKRLETLDPHLATETYRDAIYAALTAGTIRGDSSVTQVAAAVLKMPALDGPPGTAVLLEGLARVVIEGYPAGVTMLQRGLAEYRAGQHTAEEALAWLPLACRMAHDAWEFESWSALSTTLVDLANDAGALSVLPSALLLRLSNRVYAGDLPAAEALVAQSMTLGEVTGSSFLAHYGAVVTAPWRGDEAETRAVIDVVTHDLRLQGEGKVLTATEWSAAVLYNGLGEFDKALAAAQRGAANPEEMGLSIWSMVELAEAAGRLGRPEEASAALDHLRVLAEASRTHWALGTLHLVNAMVGEASTTEQQYRAAIEKIEQTEVRTLAARAYLSFGEWLRRAGRRAEARAQLSLAHDLLTQIGASGFAERARRELAAAGAATPARTATATGSALTDQEMQIARLAVEGLTNPEIGAQMFISAHTVEWHLRKVFTKLGIRSRKDIATALAD